MAYVHLSLYHTVIPPQSMRSQAKQARDGLENNHRVGRKNKTKPGSIQKGHGSRLYETMIYKRPTSPDPSKKPTCAVQEKRALQEKQALRAQEQALQEKRAVCEKWAQQEKHTMTLQEKQILQEKRAMQEKPALHMKSGF